MRRISSRVILFFLFVVVGFQRPFGIDAAKSQEAHSWPPRLTIYVGFSGSGGYDAYARLLGIYIGDYLPGHPTVVIENRPGAGGLSLMNYIYNGSTTDGSEIAMVPRGVVMDPLLMGAKSNAHFDPKAFQWIGDMSSETDVLAVSQSPTYSLQDVLDGKQLNVGSTGAGGDNYLFALLLNKLLHARLNIIPGYPGVREIELAIERDEVGGIAGIAWATLKKDRPQWLASGRIKPLLQFSLKRDPDLANVPTVGDLVSDPRDRKVVEMVLARQAMGRPLAAAPAIDRERLSILREAFDKAMTDPRLIKDSKRMNLPIDWSEGSVVQALVDQVARSSPDVIGRAQEIFGQK